MRVAGGGASASASRSFAGLTDANSPAFIAARSRFSRGGGAIGGILQQTEHGAVVLCAWCAAAASPSAGSGDTPA